MISANNVTLRLGKKALFEDVNIKFTEGNCYGLIGANGAGKSTLLKIIVQEEQADAGEVVLAKDASVGYLAQHQDMAGHRTIYEEVLLSRRDILETEERLRDMEARMNEQTGEKLEELLETYHRVSQAFELLGGFTYRSEVTGVLKGLGF